jgi:GNAT superfamily N-acetyltransferase
MPHDLAGLRTLEQVALRAWPAAEERWLGQWLLRFNCGYTKRANSAYVMGIEPDLDLDERIEAAATAMRDQDLPLIVRECSLAIDPRIGHEMQRRGFTRIDETMVMTASLEPGDEPAADQIDLDAWLRLYLRFVGGTKGDQALHREILSRIASRSRLGVLHAGGEAVSIGLAVADDAWVGLFDIATDPKRLRQGHGRMLVERLQSWGWRQGARRSYLQVMTRNAPAIALYHQLGYVEAYRYWYWVLNER